MARNMTPENLVLLKYFGLRLIAAREDQGMSRKDLVAALTPHLK